MNTTTKTIRDAAKRASRVERCWARLAEAGIKFSTVRGYHVSGETFAFRDILKANGFHWTGAEWANNAKGVYRNLSPLSVATAIVRRLAQASA